MRWSISNSRSCAGLGGEDVAQGAEAVEQPLGQRLGVDALDRIEEQQLQQLVVGQQLGAGFQHPLAHAAAMAVIVRLRLGGAAVVADAGRLGLERRGEPVGRIVAREFPALVEPVPGAARLAQQQAVRKGVADDTPAILPGLDAQSRREKSAQRVVARSDGLCRAPGLALQNVGPRPSGRTDGGPALQGISSGRDGLARLFAGAARPPDRRAAWSGPWATG